MTILPTSVALLMFCPISFSTVPHHFGLVNIEKARPAVGQDTTADAVPAQPQGCDQRGRQCESRCIPCVDDGFDLLLWPSRSAYPQANAGFPCPDHAGDHD